MDERPPGKSSGPARCALGCLGALVLVTILALVGLSILRARRELQARTDAARAVELVLSGQAPPPTQGYVRLITNGSFADNYEVAREDVAAIQSAVGGAVRVVALDLRERPSPVSDRVEGFDLTARLTRAGGGEETWTFRFAYNDLPLARICVLQDARRGE